LFDREKVDNKVIKMKFKVGEKVLVFGMQWVPDKYDFEMRWVDGVVTSVTDTHVVAESLETEDNPSFSVIEPFEPKNPMKSSIKFS